ncbi:hypothetical protein [Nocardia sp. CC227C]|uniref:hypothetical protein n=1 Tax=Nocardia sp. CC227C TaxID=3044562 RepID=UPI00278C4D23|nr:hypothetical protein [Nocardia sp. CC227C]
MRDSERIVGELRTRAQRGDTPAEVGTWLLEELGSIPNIQLASYLFHAFEISLMSLKESSNWVGLGHGGTMTDGELNQLIGPLVPRSADRELTQNPDGSWSV